MTAAILRLNDRTFASLRRHRNYKIFFSGQIVSVTGTWMQRLAQAWLVLTLTHSHAHPQGSPLAVGVLALAQFLPFTVFGLFAGVFIDRLDARRTVIATQTASMCLAAALAAIALSGVARTWHVYVIAALMGTVQVLDAPARQALTYRMVGRKELPNAVALNSSLFNASRILGPALGGVVIAVVGVGFCFLANAISFLAVLAGLLAMRVGELYPINDRGRPPILRGIRESLSYARADRRVLTVLLLTFVLSMVCFNFNVVLPLLARQTLHAGPQVFGILSAAFGAGALVGALVSAALSRASMKLLLLGAGGFGTAELLLAPVRTTALAALILFAIGVCFTIWTSNSNSLLQLSAPDRLRGRVVGLYYFAFNGSGPFGGMLVGWLCARGGTELAFLVAGTVGLATTALALARSRGRIPTRNVVAAPDEIAA